jgi:uncharacterized protein YkvS
MPTDNFEKAFQKALSARRKARKINDINRSQPNIQVGDVIRAKNDLSGIVTKCGRVNVQIHLRFRASPTGPWFEQNHKVPINSIDTIARDGAIIWTKPKEQVFGSNLPTNVSSPVSKRDLRMSRQLAHVEAQKAKNTKWVDVHIVQGNYGQGWEDLSSHIIRTLANDDLKSYNENEPSPHRIITRKILRTDYNTGKF